MLRNLIEMAVDATLGIWLMFSKFMQDVIIELGGGFSAYFNLVFWIAVVLFWFFVLKAIIGRLFPLRKTWDAVRPVFLPIIDPDAPPHPFLDFFLLSVLSGGYVNIYYNSDFFDKDLFKIALINVQIIGLLIAVTFSFSIFAMQRVANFLPNQYMNFFVGYRETRPIFLPLVFLILVSLFFPVLSPQYPKFAFWGLLTILFISFFLVYNVYIKLAERINPSHFMKKIKDDIIKFLEETRKDHECLHQKNDVINLFSSAQEKVQDLHEIGLRLLDKNEIQSFREFLLHIKNIFIEHLNLGSGYFIGNINHRLFSADKSLINDLQVCLLSSGERVIREERTVLISYVLTTYAFILEKILNIKYADEVEYNTLPVWIFLDYQKLIKLILPLENSQLTYTITQNLLAIYKSSIQNSDFNFVIFEMLIDSLKQIYSPHSNQKAEINSAISDLEKKLAAVGEKYEAQEKSSGIKPSFGKMPT